MNKYSNIHIRYCTSCSFGVHVFVLKKKDGMKGCVGWGWGGGWGGLKAWLWNVLIRFPSCLVSLSLWETKEDTNLGYFSYFFLPAREYTVKQNFWNWNSFRCPPLSFVFLLVMLFFCMLYSLFHFFFFDCHHIISLIECFRYCDIPRYSNYIYFCVSYRTISVCVQVFQSLKIGSPVKNNNISIQDT
jgi:hypothetical protein